MTRLRGDDNISPLVLAVVFIILLALGMLFAFCVAEPKSAYAQEPIVVRVGNFGKPMEPIAPAFTNDPERIVLSQNFYSVQPNARQTRNGYVSAFNYSSLTTSTVDAITTFGQQGDSAAIVFMAGGKWWWAFYGAYTAGKLIYVSSLATPREVRPFSPGSVTIAAGTVLMAGSGTYFTRYLQPGDTLYVEEPVDTFIVRTVVSDVYMLVDTLNGFGAHAGDAWQASRVYSGSEPFLSTSNEFVYTGSVKDRPQVIFNKDDTVFIRPLVMVDSFYVDAVVTKYTDTTHDGDKLRRSWSAVTGDTVIEEIQLISRRAGWIRDQWLTTAEGSPVSYFVRLGWWQNDNDHWGRFYTIRGNSDTSMYLASWYRDSLVNGAVVNLQLARGDSMVTSDISASPWAYIYTSVGAYDVAVADSVTGSASLYGRGAIWRTVDPSPYLIDTAEFYNYLYFLHLTQDDISFPSYTAGDTLIYSYEVWRLISSPTPWKVTLQKPLTQDELPDGDTILSYKTWKDCFQCDTWGVWTIRSVHPARPVQAQFVNEGFYPVRNARRNADTLWFIVSAANIDMVADTATRSTANWEIVRVGMPSWSGMTPWGNPPQLAAWGDTSSPSMVSFAQPQDPWNWTTSHDVNIGLDLSDPIVGVLGFDDQLLAFKRNSITGFDGSRFTEISNGDGLIARDALTSDNKMAYWLDVNGPKRISRRDFSGYTIEKIGLSLDPVFNTWSQGYFGTSVVPFYMNPAKKDQAVLRYNEFDEHLYLYYAGDSTTTNNRTLTYSIPRQEWDGYFTYGASAAMPFSWKDTSCILFAKNDTSRVYRTSMNWNDNGVGITSQLKSGRFWITDKSGWPIEAHLTRARFSGRGISYTLDSCQLVVSVNNSMTGNITGAVSDSTPITMSGSLSDAQYTWFPSSDLTGTYWEWRLNVKGTAQGTLFAPYEILFEFMPTSREK